MFMFEAIAIPIEPNVSTITPITDLGVFVSRIAGTILVIAAVAALIYLVYGGLSWVLSSGDKGNIENARNRITNALLGLGVTAVAWAIFLLVDYFLGLGIANGTTNNQINQPTNPVSNNAPTTPSPTATSSCAGGIKLGATGSSGGVTYKCVSPNTPCGINNPSGFSYNFLCPINCAGSKTAVCN